MHILQTFEGIIDFGFLPLSAAFLGFKEVVGDDDLDTRTDVRGCCLQTDASCQLNKQFTCQILLVRFW